MSFNMRSKKMKEDSRNLRYLFLKKGILGIIIII